jgi:oligopeptide transport system substrate-binding protein
MYGHNLKYYRYSIALSVIALLLFTACGSSSKKGSTDNVFCYNESNGITSLDPAFSRDLEIMWATNQLFDGLVEMDSNLNVIPCIAKSWSISEDGLRYEFHLRDSVYFHPSSLFKDTAQRKVVAQDFVYSFSRILSPKVASPGKWIFSNVNTGRNGGFEAINDTTLIIHLKEPFQPFLAMLSMQYCSVVPHEVVEHYGADFRSHPIGTGPFKFAFWYEDVALVFHRHEHFWQRDERGVQLPYLDAVKIDFVKDMSVEFQGLLQGVYDFMSGIHTSFKDELLDMEGNIVEAYKEQLHFQKTPFIKTDYLGIMMDSTMEISKNSPLMNLKVRQAISYAINKNEMVKYLRNNTVITANAGFVPPSLLKREHNEVNHYEYNPRLASQLLDEAGYKDRKKLGTITISTTSDYADLMEYIQHEWEKIGVSTRVNVLQGPALREQSANGQLAVFRKSWLADYPDAENFLAVFYTPNFCPAGPNYTHFSEPQYDLLYRKSRTENNDSLRIELYRSLDSLLMSQAPVIPLYYDQVSHFVRNNIHGLQTNPVNMLDLKTVKKTSATEAL